MTLKIYEYQFFLYYSSYRIKLYLLFLTANKTLFLRTIALNQHQEQDTTITLSRTKQGKTRTKTNNDA